MQVIQVFLAATQLMGFAAIAPAQDSVPQDVYVESFEGNEATIQLISTDIITKNGAKAKITIDFENSHQISVKFFRQAKTYRIDMPKRLNSIVHAEQTRIVTGETSNSIVILIPYGENLRNCFSNGQSVYSRLELEVSSDGTLSATDAPFEDCERNYNSLKVGRNLLGFTLE